MEVVNVNLFKVDSSRVCGKMTNMNVENVGSETNQARKHKEPSAEFEYDKFDLWIQ
jgi:hypothetical protein